MVINILQKKTIVFALSEQFIYTQLQIWLRWEVGVSNSKNIIITMSDRLINKVLLKQSENILIIHRVCSSWKQSKNILNF